MRKSLAPGSNEKDRSLIKIDTDNFGYGIVKDPPASTIPKNSLADGENVICYPTEVISRTGSRLYTTSELPPLAGRTGYSASKSGYIVTCDQNHFTLDDVGNYWVWPGTETEHDEIIRYIDGMHVEVADSGTKTTQVGCYMRGKINLWKFHSVQKKWLWMLGNELWLTNLDIDEWTEVLIVSRDAPYNAISDCKEFDEWSWMVFNSNGIFRVDLDSPDPIAYKINVPIPNSRMSEQAQTVDTDYQYGYIYGTSRIIGNAWFRSRLTPARIETETGANNWDDAYQDYADVWTEDPIGPSTETFAELECARLGATYQNIAGWNTIVDGTFNINVNGIGTYEVYCDFSNVTTMAEVAATIQAALRDYFSDATCEYDGDHFVLTSGRIPSGTISYCTAGATGTDIATIMGGTVAANAVISYPYTDVPTVVGPLKLPVVNNTDPQEYQWHFTHYPIYRTLDKRGLYKQGTSELRLNDPERFVWVKDLRVCGAFWARRYNGHALARIGQFEEADVGTVIEWEDGARTTILGYASPDDVIIYDAGGYYAKEETDYMAAAIGDGRVLRASQTGTTVTRTHGDVFTAADVRKTITWATGYRSIIIAFINANQVTVNDDYDKDVQGITLDPVQRYFNDTISDDTLRTRETRLLCKTRFLENMSNCNVGLVVPGYMLTAQRTSNRLEYCQLPIGYDYLAGFHNKGYQFSETIKDDIQFLLMAPNKFIALCSNRTWHGPTNISEFVTLPKTGVVVSVIGGIDILDGNIGCFDWGSIQEVQNGVYRLITSEPGGIGLRDFNGFSYGPNLFELQKTSQTNWMDAFRALRRATASIFDGLAGYIVWGRR